MNIGSSPFQKNLCIIVATVISSLVATAVLAGPNQLDILGLVPGVSELPQVKQAGSDPSESVFIPSESVTLEIGSHKIPCLMSFLDGKLALLNCFTGKGSDTELKITAASNTEVHSTLTDGFTKKFGKPDGVRRTPVRTRGGVEYERQVVFWKDERGNVLTLRSMTENVNRGNIALISAEYMKQLAEEDAAEEARKKF